MSSSKVFLTDEIKRIMQKMHLDDGGGSVALAAPLGGPWVIKSARVDGEIVPRSGRSSRHSPGVRGVTGHGGLVTTANTWTARWSVSTVRLWLWAFPRSILPLGCTTVKKWNHLGR